MGPLEEKRVLITGGSGSLGNALVKRILNNEEGEPRSVRVFSRSESLQSTMREKIPDGRLQFRIGDIRDYHSVAGAMQDVDVVIHAAAMKQVPACEYFPREACATNINGSANVVRAVVDLGVGVETVLGISTDKACDPVNVYGMTKAIMERMFAQANLAHPQHCKFLTVRYGNVLASRGSVVPMFQKQVASGKPLTVTSMEMTRFMMSLDDAVNTVFAALEDGIPGDVVVPRARSARIADVARLLIGDNGNEIREVGVRPGEKIHECLISEEESTRTNWSGDRHYAIRPYLEEFADTIGHGPGKEAFTSDKVIMDDEQLSKFLDQFITLWGPAV